LNVSGVHVEPFFIQPKHIRNVNMSRSGYIGSLNGHFSGLLLGQNFCYPHFLRFGISKRKRVRNVDISISQEFFSIHRQAMPGFISHGASG
jgi:hypothetical protein